MILCDTNIIIELFKGNRETIGVMENAGLDIYRSVP
jgi:predicted nucleic acid-binding protein